jgi:hypothetical protein
MESVLIILWVMIGIIILIAGYLAVIYIKLRISFHKMRDKEMIESRKYPCYLNIILSLVITIDNIVRLIGNEEGTVLCTIQAFILAVFDKLILTTITVNSYLTYRGLSDNEFYMNHIKLLFYVSNAISFLIAIILGIIFVVNGTVSYNVCYVMGGPFKENIDTVVSSILYLIFLYSNAKSLLFLVMNIKELSLNNNNIKAHLIHFYRMIGSLFLSSFIFLVTLLIINDSLFLSYDYIDHCYICTCLVIDLYYTLNSTVIKQTLLLFRCRKEEEDKDFYDDEPEEEERTRSDILLDDINE